MKINNSLLLPFSLTGGLILMVVMSNFGTKCHLVEPGGINEGGTGFPFHYHTCGVWGEAFNWLIVAIDFAILSLAVYLVLKLIQRLTQKH
ncbi:MAG: hypothetical protein WAZ14_04335 [Patescibacteria group bacterium]